MNLENLTQKELVDIQAKVSKELKSERFIKEQFINVLKLNQQHYIQEQKLKENIDIVFEDIEEELKKHNYIFCPHFPNKDLSVHIYNGTGKDSAGLHLEDFKIVHITENFDKDLLKIIEKFLTRGVNNER